MKWFCFTLLVMGLVGCSRKIDEAKPGITRLRVKTGNGISMFSTSTNGPFVIQIEGADITIGLPKAPEPVKTNPGEEQKTQPQ